MSRPLTIITGSSRGLGLAMAAQCLTRGDAVVGIARHSSDALAAQAAATGAPLLQWSADLADAAAVCDRLLEHLASIAPPASVTLINNAAVLPRIAALREVSAADMAQAIAVGLTATLQLTAAFLRATADWPCPRRVLNISSGNGRRAMASQATYSAVKAGMDHFSRCVALEEATQPNGAKIVSLAPGIIDTDMQTHLRATPAADFPAHAQFVEYKASGQLWTPEAAAARVLAYLDRSDFGQNPVADVRD